MVTIAAVAGFLLPGASLYFLESHALFIQGVPPSVVFGQLYFFDAWHRIFSIDNSIFVWLALLSTGYWLRRDWLNVAAASALLHILTDFPLRHDDGRAHFWPISDWVFERPVNSWNPAHYGDIIAPLEEVFCGDLCVVLWCRFKGWLAHILTLSAAVIQVLPAAGNFRAKMVCILEF